MRFFLLLLISFNISANQGNRYSTLQNILLIEKIEKSGKRGLVDCIKSYKENLRKDSDRDNSKQHLEKALKCLTVTPSNTKDLKELLEDDDSKVKSLKRKDQKEISKKTKKNLEKELGLSEGQLSNLNTKDYLTLHLKHLEKKKTLILTEYCLQKKATLTASSPSSTKKKSYEEEILSVDSELSKEEVNECKKDLSSKDACDDSKNNACVYRKKVLGYYKASKKSKEYLKNLESLKKGTGFAFSKESIDKNKLDDALDFDTEEIDDIFGSEKDDDKVAQDFEKQCQTKDCSDLSKGDFESLNDLKLQLEIKNFVELEEIKDSNNKDEIIDIATKSGKFTEKEIENFSKQNNIQDLKDKLKKRYEGEKSAIIKDLDRKYADRFLSDTHENTSYHGNIASFLRNRSKTLKSLISYNKKITEILKDESKNRKPSNQDPNFIDIFSND